jgi:hypothetical protein
VERHPDRRAYLPAGRQDRYEISQSHGIPFNTISKEFNSRDDVLIWIVSTQTRLPAGK